MFWSWAQELSAVPDGHKGETEEETKGSTKAGHLRVDKHFFCYLRIKHNIRIAMIFNFYNLQYKFALI